MGDISTDNAIQFFTTEVNYFVLGGYLVRFTGIATILLFFFSFIEIAFKTLKSTWSKEGIKLDWNYLIANMIGKTLVLWAFIPLMAMVVTIMGTIEWATDVDEEQSFELVRGYAYLKNGVFDVGYDESGMPVINQTDEDGVLDVQGDIMLENIDGTKGNVATQGVGDGSGENKKLPAFSIWQLFEGPILDRLLTLIVGGAASLINSISMITIKALISSLVSIFALMGPFAIAFSSLGVFEDKFNTWFSRFAGILGTYVTFNFIEIVQHSNTLAPLIGQMGGDQNPAVSVVTSIVLSISTIVINLLVFWLTSSWIGSSEGGKVLSTATAIGTMGAGKVMGAFGAGSGGGVSDIGKMGMDAAKNSTGFKTN